MNKFTFNNTPVLRRSRSKFDLSHKFGTSINTGDLLPFMCLEVVPGDSFKIETDYVARLTSSFIKPVMDNAFIDVHYFFVPNRLCYDRWEEVMGENKLSEWIQDPEVNVPTLSSGTVSAGTVADFLGLRPGMVPSGLTPLKFRAFALIYNQWFRDQNNVTPTYVHTGEIGEDEKYNNNAWAPNNYFGKLPKVTKFKDMFTSCLPGPQKSAPVTIPLGSWANVVARDVDFDSNVSSIGSVGRLSKYSDYSTMRFGLIGDPNDPINSWFVNNNIHDLAVKGTTGTSPNLPKNMYVNTANASTNAYASGLTPINLYADLSQGTLSVNDFRYAVQTQKYFERAARSGSRYRELLASAFGVVSPDSRLQIPEYLGGRRTPLSVQTVASTTKTEDNPLGNLGAYSHTVGNGKVIKSFVEHGFLIGVCCIRHKHTYQQGIDKSWFRTNKFDFYDPVFANISEQPIYKQQLYADANKGLKDEIFGYNEAWIEYRSVPSQITGNLRSNIPNTLDIWHFADNYSNAPTLTADFVSETDKYVDRTLTVESGVQDQFIIDFYNNVNAIRVMPTYSIPSLVDHN